MTTNPDTAYHVFGVQRDDHTQYARTDGTRAFTGAVTAPVFQATKSGTGEYVGSTNGAPLSGTFNTGDFADDPTNLTLWICTAGGTPGTWKSLLPYAIPAGRAWGTGSGTAVGTTFQVVTLAGSGNLKGGMTFTASSGTGLQVPVAGLYQVNGMFKVQNTASVVIEAGIGKNGSQVTLGQQNGAAATAFQAATVSDIVSCAANDVLNLGYVVSANVAMQDDGPGQSCYISAFLVSQ